ncbi:hypothetical protein [Kitasatospora sp. A2-31]|uniref:hypothetical protein n=1 Tax=Kitasatospora sp. A2-31 TaxID=2916414 RepID=UPI001EEA536E|nr:hypothetical protein [Kitasatospora sp. A2-31]MCG6496629.1 hypothetical protein [Kitasatospora sp. A2-31]
MNTAPDHPPRPRTVLDRVAADPALTEAADRMRVLAQLGAAGIGYRVMARSLGTTPEAAHTMARAGAHLLLAEGTAPEHLRSALQDMPPLEPPRRRTAPRTPVDGPAGPVPSVDLTDGR